MWLVSRLNDDIIQFDLNRHMKIHAERGYSCNQCGRSFIRQLSLDEHALKCKGKKYKFSLGLSKTHEIQQFYNRQLPQLCEVGSFHSYFPQSDGTRDVQLQSRSADEGMYTSFQEEIQSNEFRSPSPYSINSNLRSQSTFWLLRFLKHLHCQCLQP